MTVTTRKKMPRAAQIWKNMEKILRAERPQMMFLSAFCRKKALKCLQLEKPLNWENPEEIFGTRKHPASSCRFYIHHSHLSWCRGHPPLQPPVHTISGEPEGVTANLSDRISVTEGEVLYSVCTWKMSASQNISPVLLLFSFSYFLSL